MALRNLLRTGRAVKNCSRSSDPVRKKIKRAIQSAVSPVSRNRRLKVAAERAHGAAGIASYLPVPQKTALYVHALKTNQDVPYMTTDLWIALKEGKDWPYDVLRPVFEHHFRIGNLQAIQKELTRRSANEIMGGARPIVMEAYGMEVLNGPHALLGVQGFVPAPPTSGFHLDTFQTVTSDFDCSTPFERFLRWFINAAAPSPHRVIHPFTFAHERGNYYRVFGQAGESGVRFDLSAERVSWR